nr:hypothetical protein [Tanacetum cinerariifolium]
MIENHLIDRLVKDVLMMELVMHTKMNDIVFHMEKTGMLMLVVEIDVGGMTVDVVDKLTCSSDDVQPNTRGACLSWGKWEDHRRSSGKWWSRVKMGESGGGKKGKMGEQ